jgi:hypothetical protein
LARYQGFTSRTRFLVDPQLAEDTLLNNAAVLRAELGRGACYLFGPHFEHPHFARANQLLADAVYWDLPSVTLAGAPHEAATVQKVKARRAWLRSLKREVSNIRVVALGLESHPARWLIGRKVYEPAKLRVFAEAVWKRLLKLERVPRLVLTDRSDELLADWMAVTVCIRMLYRELHRGSDGQEVAEDLFPALNSAAARFMEIYFQNLLEEENQGRRACSAA